MSRFVHFEEEELSIEIIKEWRKSKEQFLKEKESIAYIKNVAVICQLRILSGMFK